MKKILTLIFTLSLLLTVCLDVHAEEKENVVIENEKVYYLNTSTPVQVPVTYVVDSAEMRGAWVATVWNNDMPKQNGTNEKAIEEYKQVFLKVLDTLESYNMNTIFFQVRPNNDAFYKSEYNDWSQFLVGRGVDPGWDPLEWMVEETHKRDMYFHCWMNAFRVTVEEQFKDDAINHSTAELITTKANAISALSDKNFAKQHPECVLMGDEDSKLILNPGDLNVHDHILRTLEELISNYDVDGFHFDDYFYLGARSADGIDPQLYNLAFAGGTTYNAELTGNNIMNDIPTYQDYLANPDKYDLPANLPLGEFRRQSLNNLMGKIRAMVDEYKAESGRDVEFGSKPAAVWQSDIETCTESSRKCAEGGSNTHSGAYSSNYDLFADTKAWVENEYVDWIAPQVYYDFANRIVPYADIVSWWAGIVEKTNEKRIAEGKEEIKMYVAHGIYKYHSSATEYNDVNEVTYQMRYNQQFDVIKGSAVYAYSDLVNFQTSVQKSGVGINFKQLWTNNPALPLPKGEQDFNDLIVEGMYLTDTEKTNVFNVNFPKVENASMYQLYRVAKGETLDLNDTTKRLAIYKEYKYGNIVSFNLMKNDAYDYYIQVVSDNYYPQDQAVKINFDEVKINQAPVVSDFINLGESNTLDVNDTLQLKLPYATDHENDTLTYTFKGGNNGYEGAFNLAITDVLYKEDGIYVSFTGLGREMSSFAIQVTVSDGKLTTVKNSEIFVFEDLGVDVPGHGDKVEGGNSGGGMSCNMGAYMIYALLPLGLIPIFKKRK